MSRAPSCAWYESGEQLSPAEAVLMEKPVPMDNEESEQVVLDTVEKITVNTRDMPCPRDLTEFRLTKTVCVHMPDRSVFTLHGGIFYADAETGTKLYALRFSVDDIARLRDATSGLDVGDMDGAARETEGPEIHAEIRPLIVGEDGKEGRQLHITEVAAWYAFDRMIASGERERALSFLASRFKIIPVRADGSRERRQPRTHRAVPDYVEANLDPITNAITKRSGDNAVGPAEYWCDGGFSVETGRGGRAIVTINPCCDDIDAPFSRYGINARDIYWLDHVASLFYSGHKIVTGSQLLSLCGYANPHSEGAQSTMKEAARSIDLCSRTRIAVDTTHEKRNARKRNGGLTKEIELSPVCGVKMRLQEFERATRGGARKFYDFELAMLGDDVDEAFPLSQYARSRSMVTAISRGECEFKTVKPRLETRQAWYYIIKRLHSRTSNTILYETMFSELALDEAHTLPVIDGDADERGREPVSDEAASSGDERRARYAETRRRKKITDQIERMLDEAVSRGQFEAWSRKLDSSGKTVGVSVVTNCNSDENG